ncbi:threonylcarbamoyl-AMP synthase [Candidatus Wolfebacteria bacterium RBG_13_41_7]|uniref:L-threonylcarbamoyladenylate synthase n=1 Tax=Candidatus Wolfebacteria bacterium RBG_13_41_7 TaxID=1802554 RepID=A0A1F8DLX2_9BACT|nr:MAG: threonylcarbamoyl-AMP synthase [Candidatus Wolfebacteria bacterium RBG_13_41_7]
MISKKINKKIIQTLIGGGIGVLATDTLYGLVGSALSKKAVEKIYKVRRRAPKKPLIILINSLADLDLFNIKLDNAARRKLLRFWPGKVSVIFPCSVKKFHYLHRGTKTLAIRLPKKKSLVNLTKKIGPLVAPSANLEGEPPAKTIKEAKKYFGDKIDFYVDSGKVSGRPSTLIKIENGKIVVLRKGAVKI